ncbi:hypothetical protein HNR46_003287 [Haloferula luteola]|uniref:DUF4194 domain-containing protein n=1 Tax=Haloferula luteola TaxID=595692 RepID=A0A840VBW1_9BACT|nr:DUF4194 domain-containing protein [Haloferula luteola]MBB5353034.1 hypothetical protein [Haloferula luteola]
MSPEEPSAFLIEPASSLLSLSETDRDRLAEALQELLASGSINGLEASRSALYHWARQHDDWLREMAALNGLEVAVHHEERLIQAVPRSAALRLRLTQDATLVWLALWFAGDVRWRDEGADQAFLSVMELTDLLRDQLLPDAAGWVSKGRLREILRQASRLNLIRLTLADPFEESGIEVLPAIRRVLPFRELAAWQEMAARFQPDAQDLEEAEEVDADDPS